jgi:triosephosphate isomerase
MRRPFVGGNWKMNTGVESGPALAAATVAEVGDAVRWCDVVVFPPSCFLLPARSALDDASVALGAQDVSSEANGAHTGDISAEMLKDIGVKWVIIGHSERRRNHGESDQVVAEKLQMALESGLRVVLCLGETLDERKAGQAHQVTARQLRAACASIRAEQMHDLVIAYEPVWAIGTGVSATPNDAAEAHRMIRRELGILYSPELAQTVRIVYGGSLNAANAAAILADPGIDGGLIGGASLKAGDFAQVVRTAAARGQPQGRH